jgi:hypothetical protein
MKRLLYSLSVLGLGSLLFLGLTVLDSHAEENCNPKHPLRGLWSYDEFVPYFDPDGADPLPPIPGTEIGNLNMDECGNFEGRGIFNAPNLVGGPFDFTGHCGIPEAGLLKCTVNAPAFGIVNGIRACVASARQGACFEKFSCVLGDAAVEPDIVLIAKFTRQSTGTCK